MYELFANKKRNAHEITQRDERRESGPLRKRELVERP
jgi:hypothetical protein